MGRLMVITTPNLAPGFQLAGVETFAVESVEEAEATLQKLLRDDEASLIIVRRALLQAMSDRLQRQVEKSYRPVVMPIVGRPPDIPGKAHQRHITELIRRTVGFQISFGTGEKTTSER